LQFTVKDTGVGVAADQQEKIFEAFSQVDGSMARIYGGSELGLAICTKLVGMMSGRIWVESALQQGSTFHFTVTLQAQDKRMPRAAPLQAEQLKGVRAWRIPIVAMTAHAIKGDEEKCLAAGMDGYVSKPIQTVELFSVIARMLNPRAGRGAIDAAAVVDPIIIRVN
jgi:CheY-like chemotaxis protein